MMADQLTDAATTQPADLDTLLAGPEGWTVE
jgi:hypothetical protein